MDHNDRPTSPTPDDHDPLNMRPDANPRVESPTDRGEPFNQPIVEATSVPEYVPEYTGDELPYGGPAANAPTQAIPIVEPHVPPAARPTSYPPAAPMTPLAPVYTDDRPLDDRNNGAWALVIGLVALLAGGLIGYFIFAAADDDDTDTAVVTAPAADTTDTSETLDVLLERTRADGEYVTPSEYPQLDEITAIDNAAATRELQEQVDLLTAAQGDSSELTDRVTDLETALAEVTAERDALAAQAGDTDGTVTEQQAALDAANEQIATLESELDTARTELETANEAVAENEAALQTALSELEAANATIEDLNIVQNPNFADGPVSQARSQAQANGWTLIEQPVDSTTEAPGTVVDQAPPANSNMIRGSVLYVTVAETPDPETLI